MFIRVPFIHFVQPQEKLLKGKKERKSLCLFIVNLEQQFALLTIMVECQE